MEADEREIRQIVATWLAATKAGITRSSRRTSMPCTASCKTSTYVRRYMMDGDVFPREWSAERILDSQALFERRGVETWLAYDRETNELVGFCGFENAAGRAEPQLVYAMFERPSAA
jgi:hypothetical protein